MKEPVVQSGDPVLRQKAKAISKKDLTSAKLLALIARMKKTLAGEKFGVAIAAPQLGASVRMFVVAGRVFLPEEEDEDETETKLPIPPDMVFINPELVRVSRKKSVMSEGCLSVRGYYGSVERHEKATVRAWDETGKPFIYHGSGLIAQIFQHEIDHLDGVLYTDKAANMKEELGQ